MNDIRDSYRVIARSAETEIKVTRSRFLGRATEVASREDAEEFVARLRKREFDSTHHCFAYRLGVDGAPNASGLSDVIFRYGDDGEPSGSAGKPIYDVLCGRELTQTLIVVTRWFGGTKLGVGGLTRAYADCATATLGAAGVTERFLTHTLVATVDFSTYQNLIPMLGRLEIIPSATAFTDTVTLSLPVRLSRLTQFRTEFVELTHGRGRLIDA